MTKLTHITSRPNYSIGDRVLGLCGKQFKVKMLWDSVPESKPICRSCVDVALNAMTEADKFIEDFRLERLLLSRRLEKLYDLGNTDLLLDMINENDQAHQDEQDQKAREKADAEAITKTCICVWETPGDLRSQSGVPDPRPRQG